MFNKGRDQMILGLDVSTTTVGWCVLEKNREFADVGHIDLNKVEGLFEKIDTVLIELSKIFQKYLIDVIQIEDYLGNFAGGKTNIKTLIKLAIMNGTLSYELNKSFKFPVVHVNVLRARKQIGFSNNKSFRFLKKASKDKNFTKEIIRQICIKLEPTLINKVDYTSKGKMKDYIYDEMDAYVIARYKNEN